MSTDTNKIWDLGGQREFVSMLPLVSNDAVAILFMFDLTRKSTLNSVKEWYRQARGFNKVSCLDSNSSWKRLLLGCTDSRRLQSRSLSERSTTFSPHIRVKSKRRSQSRPSGSPRRCMLLW